MLHEIICYKSDLKKFASKIMHYFWCFGKKLNSIFCNNLEICYLGKINIWHIILSEDGAIPHSILTLLFK